MNLDEKRCTAYHRAHHEHPVIRQTPLTFKKHLPKQTFKCVRTVNKAGVCLLVCSGILLFTCVYTQQLIMQRNAVFFFNTAFSKDEMFSTVTCMSEQISLSWRASWSLSNESLTTHSSYSVNDCKRLGACVTCKQTGKRYLAVEMLEF